MIGLINEGDLTRLMRLKAEEEIYDVFLWKEGDFHFVDNELPTMEMIPLKIDVTGIIMEGTRRVDEWPRIREVVPHDACVPVVVKAIELEEDFDEVETQVVDAIDGKRTIAELVLESRSSSFVVCSSVAPLVRAGFLKLIEVTAGPAAVVEEITIQPGSGLQRVGRDRLDAHRRAERAARQRLREDAAAAQSRAEPRSESSESEERDQGRRSGDHGRAAQPGDPRLEGAAHHQGVRGDHRR